MNRGPNREGAPDDGSKPWWRGGQRRSSSAMWLGPRAATPWSFGWASSISSGLRPTKGCW